MVKLIRNLVLPLHRYCFNFYRQFWRYRDIVKFGKWTGDVAWPVTNWTTSHRSAENKRSSACNFVVNGGTLNCHNDSLPCHQWRQSSLTDDLLFSVSSNCVCLSEHHLGLFVYLRRKMMISPGHNSVHSPTHMCIILIRLDHQNKIGTKIIICGFHDIGPLEFEVGWWNRQ